MNKFRTKVGILVSCICILCYLSFAPVIADIALDFPDTDISLIQMIITLPSLMFVVISPLSGELSRHFRKKSLIMSGLIIYLLGGIFPYFFHNSIWQLLAGSVAAGCGSGFVMPMVNAEICDNFDMQERGTLMGLNSAFVAIGTLSFTFVNGQLVKFGWTTCYLIYLLLIPVIVTVQVCLPKEESPKNLPKEKTGTLQINPYIAFLFILGFIYFAMQNAFNTNVSLLIGEKNLGGAQEASLATMVNTAGGILSGVLFGIIVRKLGDQIETCALGLAGIGFLLVFVLPKLLPILAGGALVGFGFSTFNSAGTFLLSKYLKPENNAFTVSVYLAFINVGASLSPFIVNYTAGLMGQGSACKYLLCGIVIVVLTAVSFCVNRRRCPLP